MNGILHITRYSTMSCLMSITSYYKKTSIAHYAFYANGLHRTINCTKSTGEHKHQTCAKINNLPAFMPWTSELETAEHNDIIYNERP